MATKKVLVIGAGFSGLASSWFLLKQGFQVEVHEARSSAGGLISTVKTDHGRYETAASTVVNSVLFEELAREIRLNLQPARRESRKRYIIRDSRPRRWPLRIKESLTTLWNFLKSRGRRTPQSFETITQWGERVLGPAAVKWLLAPALQGIYAGNADEMSASLILGRFFNKKRRARARKPHLNGTVSPALGMGELISRLQAELEIRGARFFFNSPIKTIPEQIPAVIATSFWDAQALLQNMNKPAAQVLAQIQALPLVCIQLYFPRGTPHPQGFGCLFPRQENFSALGVLFDEDTFDNRTDFHGERWILGGAKNPTFPDYPDADLLQMVQRDRLKLIGASPEPLRAIVTRWPKGLPHYDLRLEKALQELRLKELQKEGIFMIGNYLGGIGIPQILEKTVKLADDIKQQYG